MKTRTKLAIAGTAVVAVAMAYCAGLVGPEPEYEEKNPDDYLPWLGLNDEELRDWVANGQTPSPRKPVRTRPSVC